MASRIVLDTGPLGKISHPRPNREIVYWLEGLLRQGVTVYIPEIADYEVRRKLIRAGLHESMRRLDGLKTVLNFLPINTEVMMRAAELWAWARNRGIPTADPKALDADVILAAQALQIPALVATENVDHLSLFVEAKDWHSF
ncbi:MAG: type II toxin-antitoxin system VapC family toxin [Terriglobia bacterium]